MTSNNGEESVATRVTDLLHSFETYNNSEVYSFDSLGFSITGRLVSGFAGFLIIVLLLMFTFSSAANTVIVAELGGTTAFTADVVLTENEGPFIPLDTLEDEGDSVDFGYIIQDTDWDFISNMRISHFEIVVEWDANGGGGGGRQVTFDVSSQNDTQGESQSDGGNGGTITIVWTVNQLPTTVSGAASSVEAFIFSFEKEGEWLGGKFTYSSESSLADTTPLTSENISYTISTTYYTWDLDKIRVTEI